MRNLLCAIEKIFDSFHYFGSLVSLGFTMNHFHPCWWYTHYVQLKNCWIFWAVQEFWCIQLPIGTTFIYDDIVPALLDWKMVEYFHNWEVWCFSISKWIILFQLNNFSTKCDWEIMKTFSILGYLVSSTHETNRFYSCWWFAYYVRLNTCWIFPAF